MKDSILMAIESICDDIATNEGAEDNRKRAETIAILTASGLLLPEEGELLETEEDAEAAEPKNYGDKLPKPGELFERNGVSFVALGIEQGGLLAIVAEPLEEEMAYDENKSNDWRKSTLRKYLNGEYLEGLNKGDLLPFTSDLTSDDGMKDYGTSEDYVFLLSDNLYRKYRAFIPNYGAWWWTITPYSCHPSYAYLERFVHTDGSLYYNYAISAYAVAPACLFNPKIFE